MYSYKDENQDPMAEMSFPQEKSVNQQETTSPFQSVPTWQKVPNPYNQNDMQSFASGGKIARRKMNYAHVSKAEADTLDKLQGKTTRHRKSKHRAYPGLEAILKNPHLHKLILKHAKGHKEGYAEGGHVTGLEKNGRHGDTEIIMIGPRTIRLLDTLAGHKKRNPKDGLPEYFSLGKMFKGLGKTLGGIPKGIGKLLSNDDSRHALAAASAFVPGLQPFLPAIMAGDVAISGMQSMKGKKGSNPLSGLMNQAQGLYNQGQSGAQNFLSKGMEQFNNYKNKAQDYGQNMYNQAQAKGQDLYNQGQNMANQYQQQAMDYGQGLYNQGQDYMSQAQDYGQNMYGQGQQAAQGAMNQYNQSRQQFNDTLGALKQSYQQPYPASPSYGNQGYGGALKQNYGGGMPSYPYSYFG